VPPGSDLQEEEERRAAGGRDKAERGHRPGWIKVRLVISLSRSSSTARVSAFAFYSAPRAFPRLFRSRSHLRRDTNCFARVYAKLAVIAYAREAVGATGRDAEGGTGPKRILQMSRRCLSYPLPFLARVHARVLRGRTTGSISTVSMHG